MLPEPSPLCVERGMGCDIQGITTGGMQPRLPMRSPTPSPPHSNAGCTSRPYFVWRHVHLCEAGDLVVFLDLRRDKYLAVSRAEKLAVGGRIHGWQENADRVRTPEADTQADVVIESMLKLGLLTTDAHQGRPATPEVAKPAYAELIDDDLERRPEVRPGHLIAFMFACSRAKLMLRFRRFEAVVASVRRRKPGTDCVCGQQDIARMRKLVSIFNRLRPFVFTSRDACLFDSLSLVEFLLAYDIRVTWLLGIRAQPFAAHSWVQHEHLVCNDFVDHVRAFTPILAV